MVEACVEADSLEAREGSTVVCKVAGIDTDDASVVVGTDTLEEVDKQVAVDLMETAVC